MAAKIGICCHSATSHAHPPARCILAFYGVNTLLRKTKEMNRNPSESNTEVSKAEENTTTVTERHTDSPAVLRASMETHYLIN